MVNLKENYIIILIWTVKQRITIRKKILEVRGTNINNPNENTFTYISTCFPNISNAKLKDDIYKTIIQEYTIT